MSRPGKQHTVVGSRVTIALWKDGQKRDYSGEIVDLRHGKIAMVRLDQTSLGVRAIGVDNVKPEGAA